MARKQQKNYCKKGTTTTTKKRKKNEKKNFVDEKQMALGKKGKQSRGKGKQIFEIKARCLACVAGAIGEGRGFRQTKVSVFFHFFSLPLPLPDYLCQAGCNMFGK